MKITTSKRIHSNFLGERLINEFSYRDSTGESEDGMRRGFTYTVRCKVWGMLENEIRNSDGTYTYDYSSKTTNHYGGEYIRDPNESKYDLQDMVKELLFKYNIHEFSTDLQEESNNIKDYYASINANALYKKNEELHFSYSWSPCSKDSEAYTKNDNTIYSSFERIKSESLEDINRQLNGLFSNNDYIMYLMGYEVKKEYRIKFGLDDIGDNESVSEFLKRMKLETPKYPTFEKALENNEITMEDIKSLIINCKNLNALEIPTDVLEQLFSDDQNLISHFDERNVPIDILRKYNPNMDITMVNPNDLIADDLDNVLQNVIQSYCITGIYNGPSAEELKQGYWDYLQNFYDDSDALRKIIPVINTSDNYFFSSKSKEFINKIPSEVMELSEIKDILLNTENISLSKILEYELDYDTDSAKRLLSIMSNDTSRIPLEDINTALNIMKCNKISDNEILQVLRNNKFNIYVSGFKDNQNQIEEFKNFGLKEIDLNDVKGQIKKDKNFIYIKLLGNIDNDEISKEYYHILNELAEKKGKKDYKENRYEEIIELIGEYSKVEELFSNLTPDIKDLTKRLIIEKMDVMKELQAKPLGYCSKFSNIMNVMVKSFDLSEDDMVNIYIKCLNNGLSKEKVISELQKYIPEESRKEYIEKIDSLNIYPNPKYFWLTDNDLKRIVLDEGDNRATIKSKIQSDGRCFSTKITTDMVGQNKEGEKIVVNNLSKWLFGVPGARGHLTVTRSGDYIQLPSNTPDETINLIEDVLKEKTIDEECR